VDCRPKEGINLGNSNWYKKKKVQLILGLWISDIFLIGESLADETETMVNVFLRYELSRSLDCIGSV
jgi:hypothetical protein